ncbi:hydroxyacid dehydrogenase [Gammaproteobacteria bacterium 50_400_T64]|nr:hydroxyacid dehydrogenase [Gammaproteobacteria bacterium 50_400_T64]
MKIIFFSSKRYDEEYFALSNKNYKHDIRFIESKLTCDTVNLINGESAVCVFVNDIIDRKTLLLLSKSTVRLVALRCAGFNNIDINAANELGLKVVRVPAYSPYAVAEHTVCLMLSLNRKIYRAYNRVRDGNFSLDGLLGFDFSGKTIGIIGTGKIGLIVARIMSAMGMRVLAYDLAPSQECMGFGVEYVSIEQIFRASNVISLHCPLNSETRHLVDKEAIEKMRDGVMLINTSRGELLDSCAVINALKSKKIGYLGLDVYEQESELFFKDLSSEIIQDDIFERLLTFPNVLITAHQGFFTANALENIADTTLKSIKQFSDGLDLPDDVLVSTP